MANRIGHQPDVPPDTLRLPAALPAEKPIYVARGTTTRSWRQWRNLLIAAAVLAFSVGLPASMVIGGSNLNRGAAGFLLVPLVFIAFLALVTRGWARSSVTLFADRLVVDEGDQASQTAPATIQLASIRHLALAGATLRLFTGRGFDYTAVTLQPTAAEDLFDQLTEHMELQLQQRFSIDDRGALRCTVPWSFADLFPWQSTTDVATLHLDPDGPIEVRTAREASFAGFRGYELDLHEPGAEAMTSEPMFRLDKDRLHAADGTVLAKVSAPTDDTQQIDFANGVALTLAPGAVEYNGEPVGTIHAIEHGGRLELADPIPEPVALVALLVWTDRHHHTSAAHGPDADAAPTPTKATPTVAGSSVAPTRDNGETPALVIEPESGQPAAVSIFQFGATIGHALRRFLRGETSHAGQGAIAFYSSWVHVVRAPVRTLGEQHVTEFDLAYEDITRLEFIAPDTLILGFGLVTSRQNRQIVLRLNPLEAHDKFDTLVEFLEGRDHHHLFSILDEGTLRYSRPWKTTERFPDAPLLREVVIDCIEMSPTPSWTLRTDADTEYVAIGDHGLVLAAADAPEHGLLQAFVSQVVDDTGFTLSRVERARHGCGIRTAQDELLWWRDDGDVLLDERVIGHLPKDPTTTTVPDRLNTVMGTAMPTLQSTPGPRTLSLEHPLPEPWVLALVLISLLPAPREDGARALGKRID